MRRLPLPLLVLLMLVFAPAVADDDAGGIRPELAQPLEQIQTQLRRQRYRQALSLLDEVERTPELGDYERYILLRLRAPAAAGVDDAAMAIESYEAAAGSPYLDPDERLPILEALARLNFSAERYDEAVSAIQRYIREGGRDPITTGLLAQALYLADRHEDAARLLRHEITELEQAGTRPEERHLQLLINSELQAGNHAGYMAGMRKLAAYYPSEEYWLGLILRTASAEGFSDRYALDVYRLRLYTGTLKSANDYLEPAQLALQAGYPAEARRFIERGYQDGVLGVGTETEVGRHGRLQNLIIRRAAADRAGLAESADPAGQSSDALIRNGFNHVASGDHEIGLALMRRGLAASDLARPDEAALHHGYALILAGQERKARQVLREVRSEDGSRALAELWITATRVADTVP